MQTESNYLTFNLQTLNLLHEIADCALASNMGVLRVPLNVLRMLLAEVASEAIRINDLKLHILMLRLGLYEVHPEDIPSKITEIENLLRKKNETTK